MDNVSKELTDSRKDGWSNVFSIDPRSLALFRVAIGLLLFTDVINRLPEAAAMYGPEGIMPVGDVRDFFKGTWCWSLYWLNEATWFQQTLLLVTAVVAVALMLGYRTRVVVVAAWILAVSIHRRAPVIINAGDTLICIMLFWSMFLPLARVWSIDARQSKHAIADRLEPVFSVASGAIIVQLCLMYWFTAIFKFLEGWGTGHGLQNALEWGGYNKAIGDVLLAYPNVTAGLSIATVWLELLGPLLIFTPWRNYIWRIVAVAAFVALHLGIELTMHVGLFSYAAIIAWMLILPREFWQSAFLPRWLSAGGSVDKQKTDTTVPQSRFFGQGKTAAGLCAVFLTCSIAINVFSVLDRAYDKKPPLWLKRFGEVTLLRQRWAMFARPNIATNWFVARARLADDSYVDLLRSGAPVSMTRPDRLAEMFPNHRWRKLSQNLSSRSVRFDSFRKNLAVYLFREWNASHKEVRQIIVLELICFFKNIDQQSAGAEFQSVVYARIESDTVDPERTLDFDAPWQDKQKEPGISSTPGSSVIR